MSIDSRDPIEVDLAQERTEAGWIQFFDDLGLSGAPVWFGWLGWVFALGALRYLHDQARGLVLGGVLLASYGFLWLYFLGFFMRLRIKGIPWFNTPNRTQLLSLVVSGVLAYGAFVLSTSIATAISDIQSKG